MKHYIDNYLKEKDVSPATRKSYTTHLYHYYEWIKDKGKDMTTVDKVDIKNYLYQYNNVPRTYNTILITLCLLYKWMKRNGIVLYDYTKEIEYKKVGKTIPDPLKEVEISILLQATQDIKFRIPILLMLYSGLRASEVLSLRKKDFYVENDKLMIKITGKGNKERETYIYKTDAKNEIQKYLDTLRDGQKISNLTLNILEKYSNSLKDKIPNFHLHRLRKTFACKLADLGNKPEQIMLLLGHSDIKTTFIYTKYRLNRSELVME